MITSTLFVPLNSIGSVPSKESIRSIYPKLWKRIEAFSEEQMKKADSLNPEHASSRKAQIEALVNELYADMESMIRYGSDFVEIACKINFKILKFDSSWKTFEAHNGEYARDAQTVRKESLFLGEVLRKMQPDFAPFEPKLRVESSKAPVKSQITIIREEWDRKGKLLPEKDQAEYRQNVERYVRELNEAAAIFTDSDDPRLKEQVIQGHAQSFDASLERNFNHNTNDEWHCSIEDPLF